jgi:hypothetical protein
MTKRPMDRGPLCVLYKSRKSRSDCKICLSCLRRARGEPEDLFLERGPYLYFSFSTASNPGKERWAKIGLTKELEAKDGRLFQAAETAAGMSGYATVFWAGADGLRQERVLFTRSTWAESEITTC